jgi:hypothetical protein
MGSRKALNAWGGKLKKKLPNAADTLQLLKLTVCNAQCNPICPDAPFTLCDPYPGCILALLLQADCCADTPHHPLPGCHLQQTVQHKSTVE